MPFKKITALLLAATLSACVASGQRNGPYAPSSGSVYERQVIAALGETTATAAQRQAVLGAFDALGPRLKDNDRDDMRLQQRWQALDPHASDYLAQADALAQQAAALAANRLKALAQFNQVVASTLDHSQWLRWSNVMNEQLAAFENGRRLDPSFHREER